MTRKEYNTKIEPIKTIRELVEFLQDNTNLAENVACYGGSKDETENNPEGDYATIERWLESQVDLEDLTNI